MSIIDERMKQIAGLEQKMEETKRRLGKGSIRREKMDGNRV